MNYQSSGQTKHSNKLRFTYIVLVLSFILLIISLVYSSWRKQSEHEANLPKCGIETVVASLRTFHSQTGRFPEDFRELDERIWKSAKREQISEDGRSLNAPSSHYFYVLHVINPTNGVNTKEPSKAGIWAVPTGTRSNESATHFWYITPDNTERWMGPALTSENIHAVKSIPTEGQLSLLVMTKQTNDSKQQPDSLFPFLGL